LALLLCGCGAGNKLATFSAGDAKLSVKLPAFCEGFLQPVAVPNVDAKTDARVAYSPSGKELATPDRKIGNSVVQKGRMTDLHDAAAPEAWLAVKRVYLRRPCVSIEHLLH
jgi:hypothetical protein